MASHRVIRNVKGHQYEYIERSVRIPGVRTPRKQSIYLGPVGGHREGNQAAMYTDEARVQANQEALAKGLSVGPNGEAPPADNPTMYGPSETAAAPEASQENAPSDNSGEGEASE